jgi:LysM repeat protein
MQRRSALFLIFNVALSIAIAIGLIALWQSQQPQEAPAQVVITVPILITATTDPFQPTQTPFIITPTLPPGTSIVQLPTGLVELTAAPRTGEAEAAALAAAGTVDPTLLAGAAALAEAGAVTALPDNCIPYTLQSGDTPYGIALQYGADYGAILAVNGLSEQDAQFLQIGQVLIVPLEGCTLAAQALVATQTATGLPTNTPTITPGGPTATLTPSETPTATRTPRPSNTPEPSATRTTAPPTATRTPLPPTATFTASPVPTATLPATAVNAPLELRNLLNAGTAGSESIDIFNTGATTNIANWRLRVTGPGGSTLEYTFREQNVFTNALITLYTGTATDTTTAKYWNQGAAVFTPGSTIALLDAAGVVQAVVRVPAG